MNRRKGQGGAIPHSHENRGDVKVVLNLFNAKVMSHVYKKRQKRVSLPRFLVKGALEENGPTEPVNCIDSIVVKKTLFLSLLLLMPVRKFPFLIFF